MIVKIGRYKFKDGKGSSAKRLSPLSLEEMKDSYQEHSLPQGRIIVKRPDYALLKVTRKEPVIGRLLKLTKSRDKAKSFILLYVRNTIAGYKSKNSISFLPFFKKRMYKEILKGWEIK